MSTGEVENKYFRCYYKIILAIYIILILSTEGCPGKGDIRKTIFKRKMTISFSQVDLRL